MSLLPQRKKSPEEIAKLREDLGIHAPLTDFHAASPAEPPSIAAPPREIAPDALTPTADSNTPLPEPGRHAPKRVHSLKRSENTPTPPPDAAPVDPTEANDPTEATAPQPHRLTPGRSLRKSDPPLAVVPQDRTTLDSNLPRRRHSDEEIEEIRHREALALLTPVVNPKLIAAHPVVLVPGYLSAIAGAPSFAYYQLPLSVSASCAATSLLIACFITLKKPLSLHHAAFISTITLFVIVFGALHYFPQLRHGS